MSNRRPGCVVARLAAACLSTLAFVTVVNADEPLHLHIDDGLLTIEVRDVPISAVVRAIGEQAGFETVLLGDLEMPVSASLAGVPVREALERLLGDANRIVVTDADRAIVRLWLLGSSDTVRDGVEGETERASFEPDLPQADAKARGEALLRLANLGATQPVLEVLIRSLLEDVDALVRTRAAVALGKLGDEGAVPALESALSDDHGSVRTQAIQALGLIGGEGATMALGDVVLRGTDNRERVVAAQGLVRQGTDLARRYLDAVADDPDQQIRAIAQSPSGNSESQIIEIPEDLEKWGPESRR